MPPPSPYGEHIIKQEINPKLIENIKKIIKNDKKFPQYCIEIQTILKLS